MTHWNASEVYEEVEKQVQMMDDLQLRILEAKLNTVKMIVKRELVRRGIY